MGWTKQALERQAPLRVEQNCHQWIQLKFMCLQYHTSLKHISKLNPYFHNTL